MTYVVLLFHSLGYPWKCVVYAHIKHKIFYSSLFLLFLSVSPATWVEKHNKHRLVTCRVITKWLLAKVFWYIMYYMPLSWLWLLVTLWMTGVQCPVLKSLVQSYSLMPWLLLWSQSILDFVYLFSSCLLVFLMLLSFPENPAFPLCAQSRTTSVLSSWPLAMFHA